MKHFFLSAAIMAVMATTVSAADFQIGDFSFVENEDGSTCTLYNYNQDGNPDVVIPETVNFDNKTLRVTSISSFCFYNNNTIESVVVPASITEIKDYSFEYCGNLVSVSLPSTIQSIGQEAFYSCESLESINIPAGITSIAPYTFCYCSNLDNITLPEGITNIGEYAFDWCESLKQISFPSTLTRIGDYAFYSCLGLKEITIPATITWIGQNSFGFCLGATKITVDSAYIGESAFLMCESLTDLTIGNHVKVIDQSAFFDCNSLTSAYVPASVIEIRDAAFSHCDALASIEVASANANYSSYDGALYNKPMTTLIVYPAAKPDTYYRFPSTVTGLATECLNGALYLKGVELSQSMVNVEAVSLFGSSIETVDVAAANPRFSSIDGVLVSKNRDALIWYPSGRTAETYTIPSSITTLGEYSMGTSQLVYIDIPETVTSIGIALFHTSKKLERFSMPSGFKGELPQGIAYNCYGLQSVKLPNGITAIGANAFQGCEALKQIDLPAGIKKIGYLAFAYNYALEAIKIPNTVKEIGGQAFYYCNSAKTLYIPENVEYIDVLAFYGCYGLETVYYPAAEPVEGGSDMFMRLTYQNALLRVSPSAYAKIPTLNPWSEFQNVEAYDFTGVETVEAEAEFDMSQPMEVYNLGGLRVSNRLEGLAPGLYILRQGNLSKKVMVK